MSEFFSIVSEPSVCKFLQLLIIIPFLAGILLFIVPEKYLKNPVAIPVNMPLEAVARR